MGLFSGCHIGVDMQFHFFVWYFSYASEQRFQLFFQELWIVRIPVSGSGSVNRHSYQTKFLCSVVAEKISVSSFYNK